jgi:hypothetical protein
VVERDQNGGERGIRTTGTVLPVQRFSKSAVRHFARFVYSLWNT